MTDDFLSGLKVDWHRQVVDINMMRQRVRRRVRVMRIVSVMELVGAALAMLVGAWFAAEAIEAGDPLLALSGFALLLATPVLAVSLFRARRGVLQAVEATPEGVLRGALRQADSAVKALRVGRWSIYVLLALVAGLWAGVAVGLIEIGPVIPFSVVWIGTALLTWCWLRWRQRRIAKERELCERLLLEYGGAD